MYTTLTQTQQARDGLEFKKIHPSADRHQDQTDLHEGRGPEKSANPDKTLAVTPHQRNPMAHGQYKTEMQDSQAVTLILRSLIFVIAPPVVALRLRALDAPSGQSITVTSGAELWQAGVHFLHYRRW
jgi:hypothetical protein